MQKASLRGLKTKTLRHRLSAISLREFLGKAFLIATSQYVDGNSLDAVSYDSILKVKFALKNDSL